MNKPIRARLVVGRILSQLRNCPCGETHEYEVKCPICGGYAEDVVVFALPIESDQTGHYDKDTGCFSIG